MAPRDQRPLRRTSVQLPEELLASLALRWPGLSVSEQLRLALERHEYIAREADREMAKLIEIDGAAISAALQDYDVDAWRTIARALPAIVEAAAAENDRELKDSTRTALAGLQTHHRLALFDWAQKQQPAK